MTNLECNNTMTPEQLVTAATEQAAFFRAMKNTEQANTLHALAQCIRDLLEEIYELKTSYDVLGGVDELRRMRIEELEKEVEELRRQLAEAQARLAELDWQEPFGSVENGKLLLSSDGGPEKYRLRKSYCGPVYASPATSPAGHKDVARVQVTLTGKEIRELAEFAGFSIVDNDYTDENETEMVVETCPESGILNDDNRAEHYRLIAYLAEYPEEGCLPLGDKIDAALATAKQIMEGVSDG